jgi:hypothetical protein
METEGWYKVSSDLHHNKDRLTTVQDAFTRVLVLSGGDRTLRCIHALKTEIWSRTYISRQAQSASQKLLSCKRGRSIPTTAEAGHDPLSA